MSRSLSTEELAERWNRDPIWITRQARQGEIPGAWKLGRSWRFLLTEIEAYETARSSKSFFALTDLSRKRQQNIRNSK